MSVRAKIGIGTGHGVVQRSPVFSHYCARMVTLPERERLCKVLHNDDELWLTTSYLTCIVARHGVSRRQSASYTVLPTRSERMVSNVRPAVSVYRKMTATLCLVSGCMYLMPS